MTVSRNTRGISTSERTILAGLTQPNPSTHKKETLSKGKGKAVTESRAHTLRTSSRRSDADLALKKSRRERIIQEGHKGGLSHVFVGNLNKTTSESTLARIFSSCGPVHYVSIRCSVVPSSEYVKGEGIHYAVVAFRDPTAYVRALKLCNVQLDDCFIVVCHTVDELPEMRRLTEKRAQHSVPKGRELCSQPTLNTNHSGSAIREMPRTKNHPRH